MSLSADWILRIRSGAYKELVKLPAKDRDRIVQVIKNIPFNPYAGDIEKMKGEENVWRRRVGAYRIFFEIITEERVIWVFRVERRTSKTY